MIKKPTNFYFWCFCLLFSFKLFNVFLYFVFLLFLQNGFEHSFVSLPPGDTQAKILFDIILWIVPLDR